MRPAAVGGWPSRKSCNIFRMVPVSNGFFSTGSIFKPVLLADALHMLEHGGAAGAHELHVARIPVLAERDDAFDGFGRFDRDIEKHEVGGAPGQRDTERCAVGELLRVDAAAMQDERKEMPDAAVNVGDEAEWRARIVTPLFGVALCWGDHGFCRRRSCAHCQGGKHNIG